MQDVWSPPPGVKLVQIAGWGLPTTNTLRYFKELYFDGSANDFRYRMGHKLDVTPRGDGTVVSFSAAAQLPSSEVKTFYFDMAAFNTATGESKVHSNMLGAPPLQDLIRNLVLGHSDPLSGANYVYTVQPTHTTRTKRITVKSAAELHVYDYAGRHTGPAPQDPSVVFPAKEQQIPSSFYETVDSHAVVTLLGDTTYEIRLKGTSYGMVGMAIETFDDELLTSTTNFAEIPFSPSTLGKVIIQGQNVTQLSLDQGDGKPMIYVNASERLLPGASITALISIVKSLRLKPDLEADLVDTLNSAVLSLGRNQTKAGKNQLTAFINAVSAQQSKAIESTAAKGLVAIATRIIVSI